MADDPYETLGVVRGADQAEIKAAYIAAAKRFHPDVVGDAESGERMRAINLAYEILSSVELRERYDEEFGAGSRSSGDELEDLVRVWVDEAEVTDLRQEKLRTLGREQERLEREGWKVERRHDHLVGTKTERNGLFAKGRKRCVTVNIDRDGRPFQVEQKRPD